MTNNELAFLNYINKPLSRERINQIYVENHISLERCELYSDFVESLIMLVIDTYLGDDVTDSNQQKQHFKWCWNKTIDNFGTEGILIGDYNTYKYFAEYIFDVFYPLPDKDTNRRVISNIRKLWVYIFDTTNVKSRSDLDSFIQAYKLLDNSLQPL